MKTRYLLTTLITLFTYQLSATTYYVSSTSGADTNNGTASTSPWQSIDQANGVVLDAGDSVLFKRGDIWRGQLIPQSGNNSSDIYYGAYGTGSNPTFLGSLDYSDTDDWINQGSNIWECNENLPTDVGNIIFDDETSVGYKKWNQSDLLNQDDFWYDLTTNKLQIYSNANPATIHAAIELAIREHIVDEENASYVTYENLSLKYGGAHGFGGGNTSNISILSCEISYMGGGDLLLNGTIRFGNGVEFWGNASNNRVEKCKIWEIYDSGITNQNNTENAIQENITYRNNIVWNCGLASYEYWNRPESSQTSDIYFEHNTCLNAGSGWGSQRPDYQGSQVILDNNTAQTGNIYIRNNIFSTAQRFIYAIEDNINGSIQLDYNLIHQSGFSDSLFIGFPSFVNYKVEDLAAYTEFSGNDANSIAGDPSFINASTSNFQLSNTSPCIDAAVQTNIIDDFSGNERPMLNGYDIGAYEYTSEGENILEINSIDGLSIYPNPVENLLTIRSADQHVEQITVLNVDGSTVLQTSVNTSQETMSLDLSKLNSGIYFLVVTGNKASSITQRILKY